MIYLPLIVALMFLPLDARAGDADYTTARLKPSVMGTGDLSEIDMGLDIVLKDQWYTYWRMPGDNGVAPTIDWAASKNVKEIAFSWPAPKRFTLADMHSFGYAGHVLFPMKVVPLTPGNDITVNIKLDIMVCHDICIPQTITMERIVSKGPATPSEYADEIKQAIHNLPQEDLEGIQIDGAVLGKDSVVVTLKAQDKLSGDVDMIIEAPGGILSKPPEIIPPAEEGDSYIFKIRGPEGADLTDILFGKDVTVLFLQDGQALEKKVSF